MRVRQIHMAMPLMAIVLGGIVASPVLADELELAGTPRIEDNSFLIEEAYNQESRVVQHISAWQWDKETDNWEYAFTQEWPFTGQTHQLSYTILITHAGDPQAETGLGDVLLNYRYQLVNDDAVAFAPRFSLALPTGDETKGFGAGSVGFQTNLPLSVSLSERWVMHWNLGGAFNPDEHDSQGNTASTTDISYGTSAIFLMSSVFNPMLEIVGSYGEVVEMGNSTSWEESLFINPGARYALNFRSGLQVVIGASVPIGLGPSEGEWGVLAYTSFEHPF